MTSNEIQTREYVTHVDVKENGPVDSYNFSEQQLQQVPVSEKILEETPAEDFNDSSQNTFTYVQDHFPASLEDSLEEPQKHTYASIVITGHVHLFIFNMFS